jgi:hypothetical protein
MAAASHANSDFYMRLSVLLVLQKEKEGIMDPPGARGGIWLLSQANMDESN